MTARSREQMLVIRQVPAEDFAGIISRLAQLFPEAQMRYLLTPAEMGAIPDEARLVFDRSRDGLPAFFRRLRAQGFVRAAWATEPDNRTPKALMIEALIASLGVKEKLICYPNRPWQRVGRASAMLQPVLHTMEAASLAAAGVGIAAFSFLVVVGTALLSDLLAWRSGE